MIRYKTYLCMNEECNNYFRRSESNCKSNDYCSIECCKKDFKKKNESFDDHTGCQDCIGGSSGSWVTVNTIAEMCGEPIWGDLQLFRTLALVYLILNVFPEVELTERQYETLQKIKIVVTETNLRKFKWDSRENLIKRYSEMSLLGGI